MTTETIGWLFFGSQYVAFIVFCYVCPFYYVLHSGRFWIGVIIGWATAAIFSFGSVMLGQFLYHYGDRALVDYCMEGPHFMAFAFCGWWQGIIVSGGALILYRKRKRLANNQAMDTTMKINPQ